MIVRDLLRRSLRQLGKLARGQGPNASDMADGLMAINAMFAGMYGHGVGPKLAPATVQSGETFAGGLYAENITTPLDPVDGHRIGVTGARTVTARAGCTIEGVANVTTTAGGSWFYRADLADWTREKVLEIGDDVPFPPDLDNALVALLAIALAPEFDATVTDETALMAAEGRSTISQRYGYRAQSAVSPELLYFPSRRRWGGF